MKARVACGVLAWLLVAACNRPDSVLFSDVDTPPGSTGGTDAQNLPPPTAGNGVGGSHPAAVAGSGGTTGGSGGSSAPMDGGAPSNGEAGAPDAPGMAGASDGGGSGGSGGAAVAGGGTGGKPGPVEPVCGNGKRETGEECDDGGHEGKDGCSAACKVVCGDHGEGAVKSEDFHCYVGFDQNAFEGAVADCKALGAHIVSITSAAENEVVSSLVRNSKWIGGFENVPLTSPGGGQYEWVTGEPFGYENWAEDEPDSAEYRCNSNGPSIGPRCYEHCILMEGGGIWLDSRCDVSDGYICEWEPAGE